MKTHLVLKEYDIITCNKDYKDIYPYICEKTFEDLEKFILKNKSDNSAEAIELLDLKAKKGIGKIIGTKNYVGLIQLNDGTQIEILPKIYCQKSNDDGEIRKIFLNMLRSFKNFPYKSFNMSALDTGKMNLYDIFINMYIQEVRNLVKMGLKSDYINYEGNENFYKGKILFNEHIKLNLTHMERAYIRYDIFNINRPENKLIKTTLLKLLKICYSNKNKKEIEQLLPSFEKVDISYNYNNDFSKININRHNIEYDIVLQWSRIFLNNKSFTTFAGEDNARALLFPMEKVFESYIAQQLKKKMVEYDCLFKIQDKKYYLFDEPRQFSIQPDIVIEIDGKTFILDTKWKLLNNNINNNYGISQLDMYQMYVYAKKYNADEVFLIYPKNDNIDDLSLDVMKTFSSYDNVRVNIAFIDLGDVENSLDNLIQRIVR